MGEPVSSRWRWLFWAGDEDGLVLLTEAVVVTMSSCFAFVPDGQGLKEAEQFTWTFPFLPDHLWPVPIFSLASWYHGSAGPRSRAVTCLAVNKDLRDGLQGRLWCGIGAYNQEDYQLPGSH